MVYSNKFVVAVLVNGTIQKELANGEVKLPFNSEYALRLRNKHSRRAVVKIYIDGENVSGNGYVIPANDYIDIQRHHDKDRAFKFVSLDSEEAVDFGKNGPNPDKMKGTIEARFYLEKEPKYVPPVKEVHHHHHHHNHHHHDHYPIYPAPSPWVQPRPTIWMSNPENSTLGGKGLSAGPTGGSLYAGNSGQSSSYSGAKSGPAASGVLRGRSRTVKSSGEVGLAGLGDELKELNLEDGCTVHGESTGQTFSTTWIDMEDNYTSLKVFLRGYEDEDVVETPKKPHRKTNKENRLDNLEAENEELRRKLAELENEQLKKKLKDLESNNS